jgi:aryl-alcohol dehydrogenase-like predicted oxidoreductase
MKQLTLGSQGLRVPAVGLGCMGMSDFYGASSEAQNLAVLERARALGCTFWDTSDMYGPFTNELLLAKALRGTAQRSRSRRSSASRAEKTAAGRGSEVVPTTSRLLARRR